MSTDTKESGLSRWARRKQEARQAPEAVSEMPAAEAESMLDAPVAGEISEEPVALTDADMPDIGTLGEDSDFTGFMSPGVSDELRNLALRKLFHAPVFNIRDGLDEYDEDYTSFEKLGDIVTCDMKHQIEVQERKRREAQEHEDELAQEQENQARAEAELEDIEGVEDMGDEDAADITDDGMANEVDQSVATPPADDNSNNLDLINDK
jgi:Protein of unknown function (DUF3306)